MDKEIKGFKAGRRTAGKLVVGGVLALSVMLAGPGRALAGGQVGQQTPWFRLNRLTGGQMTNFDMRGKTTVLVVGRTPESAPPCKKWLLDIHRRYGARVASYMVVVAKNPWFIPRALVRKMLRDFTPRSHYHRVLVEWKEGFARLFGIPEYDDPTLVVLDPRGVVRWRHRGPLTRSAANHLDAVLVRIAEAGEHVALK